MRSECPSWNRANKNRRLRQEFDNLPKVSGHGSSAGVRHSDVLPEWIMRIIKEPYDRWEEVNPENGEVRTILAGRVRQSNQWIKVVFSGTGDSLKFITAYQDRRLARKYGGRKWQNQQ